MAAGKKSTQTFNVLPFRQVSSTGVEVLADRHNFFALIVSHFHVLKELVSHHLKCIFRPRLTKNKNEKQQHSFYLMPNWIVAYVVIFINNVSYSQGT